MSGLVATAGETCPRSRLVELATSGPNGFESSDTASRALDELIVAVVATATGGTATVGSLATRLLNMAKNARSNLRRTLEEILHTVLCKRCNQAENAKLKWTPSGATFQLCITA